MAFGLPSVHTQAEFDIDPLDRSRPAERAATCQAHDEVRRFESVQLKLGGHVGAGVDFHLARSFAVGVNGGYNWMIDFSRPVGPRDNYSGAEFGLSLGWLFGRGRIKQVCGTDRPRESTFVIKTACHCGRYLSSVRSVHPTSELHRDRGASTSVPE